MLMCSNSLSIFIIVVFCCVTSMAAESERQRASEIKNHNTPAMTDSLNMEISTEPTVEKQLEESRGWKKSALPFLLGITLKMTTLLPMISSLMTVIGGVALVASKFALILSIGLAIHYYMVTKHQMQFYRQPLSHSAIYDSVLPVTPYPVSHRLSVQAS